MGISLEKIVLGFRAVQLPISFLFLVCICWVEAVSSLGKSHIITTVLRCKSSFFPFPPAPYPMPLKLPHSPIPHTTPQRLTQASSS